jgi:hypothetical protein
MIECPHKPGLLCPATARIIVDGRCAAACPCAEQEMYSNPRDGFGAALGHRFPERDALAEDGHTCAACGRPFFDHMGRCLVCRSCGAVYDDRGARA